MPTKRTNEFTERTPRLKSTRQLITDKLFLDVFLVYPGIAAKEKRIVTDRNGRKSSKLLVEFKAKKVKDKIPLRKQGKLSLLLVCLFNRLEKFLLFRLTSIPSNSTRSCNRYVRTRAYNLIEIRFVLNTSCIQSRQLLLR